MKKFNKYMGVAAVYLTAVGGNYIIDATTKRVMKGSSKFFTDLISAVGMSVWSAFAMAWTAAHLDVFTDEDDATEETV